MFNRSMVFGLPAALLTLAASVLGCNSTPPDHAAPDQPPHAASGNLDLTLSPQAEVSNQEQANGAQVADTNDAESDGTSKSPPADDRFDEESQYHHARDQFQAADDPLFINADDVNFLQDDDEVLGFVINGEARAYSVMALSYHHVVNDTFGDSHLAVTY